MKKIILTFLFAFGFLFAHAQQDDAAFLEKLYQHSANSFKNISGAEDEESSFVSCTLKPEIGNIKIYKNPYVVTLNWSVPLEQSASLQKKVKELMNVHFSDTKKYKTASEGTEKDGQIWTNVYELNRDEKPLVIFKTIYYKAPEKIDKSTFTIVFYGK